MNATQNLANDVTALYERLEKLEKENALHHEAFAEQARIHEQRITTLERAIAALRQSHSSAKPTIVKDKAPVRRSNGRKRS